jgi:hypothetical protein
MDIKAVAMYDSTSSLTRLVWNNIKKMRSDDIKRSTVKHEKKKIPRHAFNMSLV